MDLMAVGVCASLKAPGLSSEAHGPAAFCPGCAHVPTRGDTVYRLLEVVFSPLSDPGRSACPEPPVPGCSVLSWFWVE